MALDTVELTARQLPPGVAPAAPFSGNMLTLYSSTGGAQGPFTRSVKLVFPEAINTVAYLQIVSPAGTTCALDGDSIKPVTVNGFGAAELLLNCRSLPVESWTTVTLTVTNAEPTVPGGC